MGKELSERGKRNRKGNWGIEPRRRDGRGWRSSKGD